MIREKRVAITGRMASMSRLEAAGLIAERGGELAETVSRKTDLLVIGQEGWPITPKGRLSRKLRRARELGIEIVSEEEFLRRLGLADETKRLHTTAQLSRLLDVPGHVLRSWVRKGLLTPARTEHRLSYFDFRQAVAAKALAGLVAGGADPERLRAALQDLRQWLDVESPLQTLSLLGEGKDLLVRLEDGRLAEAGGQLRFDFSPRPPAGAARVAPPPETDRDWFEEGLEREDEGDLTDAVAAYELAIRIGGREPETCFNLGNVLYRLDRKEEALRRYREAVDLDPGYVEAWNNHGSVLAELGRERDAILSFVRAIAVKPDYADAHYNLAETLHGLGRTDEARRHWREFLKGDARSSFADHARRRLEET